MAADNPGGLQPRKLEGEVEINGVPADKVSEVVDRTESKPATDKGEQQPVSENTEAVETVQPTNGEEEYSPRANDRIQRLANEKNQALTEKAQAEARAQYFEQMAQRMVNVQQQPTQSQDELLARQFPSYDAKQGYPTDPQEFLRFSDQRARLAAQEESRKLTKQQSENWEAQELLGAYPNALNDPAFMGAITGIKNAATQQGRYISLKGAADTYNQQINQRANQKVTEVATQQKNDVNEAYVETTRGASTSRAVGKPVDPDTMSLDEMEAFLKQNGNW